MYNDTTAISNGQIAESVEDSRAKAMDPDRVNNILAGVTAGLGAIPTVIQTVQDIRNPNGVGSPTIAPAYYPQPIMPAPVKEDSFFEENKNILLGGLVALIIGVGAFFAFK